MEPGYKLVTPRTVNLKCKLSGTLAPGEFQATVTFGTRNIYVLAPRTKVDPKKGTIEIQVVGELGDQYVVSLPGIVENAGSTITVEKGAILLETK